ncbi:MAG: sigma-70 family RNA polymerase sigma factor [Prevotella sp.]|nr:sigma-70 family RNA polymerase sigma factor [Prevotella sp.]
MTSEEFKQEAQAVRHQLISQARRYLGDTDEAEDVVQDALLRLWQMHSELQSPLARMAMVVVRNLAIDRLRKRKFTEPLDAVATEEEPSPDNRTERLLSVMESLPTLQQTILRMRHMEGMEMSDIAEIVGSTEVAMRKALSRARQALREKYLTMNKE